MRKYEPISLDKVYVPVKRRKNLDFAVVKQIAESILEVGQETPILVRPDQSRFVLDEGLHRLEACRALGETTILASIVSARTEPEAPLSPAELRAEAERQKIQRLRQLRLEREAAERNSPSLPSTPAARTPAGGSTPQEKLFGTSKSKTNKKSSNQKDPRPASLSDWIAARERDGFRF